MINYVTNSDLCDIVRRNMHKIPHDIDGVIGVPRGGLFVAVIVSEFLNVPLYSVESFIRGETLGAGKAGEGFRPTHYGKYAVIDDSVELGGTMSQVKELFANIPGEFVYVAAICENSDVQGCVDIVLEHVDEFRLFELNLFRIGLVERMILDIDGVLCENPRHGIDLDEGAYVDFILHTRPRFPVLYSPLALCTSRLLKYSEPTIKWLCDNNISYQNLYMLDIGSVEEKMRLMDSPEVTDMKATVYNMHPEAILFIESDKSEAEHIFSLTGRPVLCTDTNTMIQ